MSNFGKLHSLNTQINDISSDIRACSADVHNTIGALTNIVDTVLPISNTHAETIRLVIRVLKNTENNLNALAN